MVIGRGGPNLSRGLLAFKDVCDSLGLPYRIFGFDSAMTDVVRYAQEADRWMKNGGREMLAAKLGAQHDASGLQSVEEWFWLAVMRRSDGTGIVGCFPLAA